MTDPRRTHPPATTRGGELSSGLLTAGQVAERWQVPAAHVYRLARQGEIPCVALGRYKRFRLDAIDAFELDGGGRTG